MNYLQLTNRLKLECGVPGPDLTTLVSASGEYNRLAQWIASAWQDIQAERQDWEWLRTSTAFPTSTGRVSYSLSQCNTSNFGKWSRDTFRNYVNPTVTVTIANPCVATILSHGLSVNDTVVFFTDTALPTGITSGVTYYVTSVTTDTFQFSATSGGSPVVTTGTQSGTHTISTSNVTSFVGMKSEILMSYKEYDTWRNQYLLGAVRYTYTRPLEVTIYPDKSLGLGPLALNGYTIIGDYFTAPVNLSADTDIPAMPVQFHLAIVYRAMMAYGAFEAAPEVYTRGETEFNKVMDRISADRLPEVAFAGALA